MKILMSYAEGSHFLANAYFNNLKSLIGEENILGFKHSEIFQNYRQKNTFTRIVCRLYPDYIYTQISKSLIKEVDRWKPNILLLFKGQEILPETLKKIKKQGVYLVNYNLDHPFDYFSKGSGNKNVFRSLSVYDLHITYSKQIQEQLAKKLPKSSNAFLPFGYFTSIDEERLNRIKTDINEVCFIGNPDRERLRILKLLIKEGIKINIYGHGWDKYPDLNEKANIREALYGKDYLNTISMYRIQLNIFRPHNHNSHNMRTFEVPAAGGIQLAPYSVEQTEFFVEDKEVFFYKNDQELVEKAKQLLALPQSKVVELRQSALFRSIKSNYSYSKRTQQLHNILKSNYEGFHTHIETIHNTVRN